MKKIHPSRSVVTGTVACLLLLSAAARSEDALRYKAKPTGSKVTIDGTSNVHDWKMEGTLIAGYLEVPAGVVLDSSQAALTGASDGKLPAKAEVQIRVSSMNNVHKYEGMDQAMQEAMNAKDYPWIKYSVTEMTLKQPHAAGTPFQFDTKGDLSFDGVTNTISMPVSIETIDKGKLKVTATGIPVKMTDFKVKPPVKALVFITDPDVKISFEWIVGLPAKAADAK